MPKDTPKDTDMLVRFWGVRGSIPAPISNAAIEDKILASLKALKDFDLPHDDPEAVRAILRSQVPFPLRATYGGNTPCIELRCGVGLIVLDMGSGLRSFGNALMKEVLALGGVYGRAHVTHVHWDHIQGFPFCGPFFLPRELFDCFFSLIGGQSWDAALETVLAGQMDPPLFPVSFKELCQTAMRTEYSTVHDRWQMRDCLEQYAGRNPDGSTILRVNETPTHVVARALNHPNKTFGYRIEHGGHVVAYTTDHEPYGAGVPSALVDLVRGADVWITDCQHTREQYTGEAGGVSRQGWGHSYPEYVAEVARVAQPKRVLTFHHDPAANDETIAMLARRVESLSAGIPAEAAYEGMEIVLDG
jgi:phosphoribosyl 1,2-cyclic phosphodiesterase